MYAALLIAFAFTVLTTQKINNRIAGNDTCLCANDGFGYYMYLPSIINRGEIEINTNWAQDIQNTYCDSNLIYQIVQSKIDKPINIYHIGLSYIKLPSYIIAHTISKNTSYPTDGFSLPYYISHYLNALFFILLGLHYLRKLLLLYTSELNTSLIILVAYFGTNMYATFSIQADLPHLYLFTLNTIFIYHLMQYISNTKYRDLIITLIVFGIATAIRPTQAVLGIIPLILLQKKLGFNLRLWKQILLFPLASILFNIPQFLYWKYLGGEWVIPNLHTEDIVLIDPNTLDFLFSFRKGWFLYSPVFILLIPGFIYTYRINKPVFWSIFTFTFLYIWILSSWECWWYAGSFGSRVMVDIYPFLLLIIGIGLPAIKSNISKASIISFSLICIGLNLFQTRQLNTGIIDSTRMSKEHYLYTFGRLEIDKFNNSRLLMNRYDTNWIHSVEEKNLEFYQIQTKEIFALDKTLIAKPKEDLTIGRFTILDELPSDESLITVRFTAKSNNPSETSIIRLETVSPYNCYSWNSMEISQGSTKDLETEYEMQFNLPDIRHRNDEMQLYIDNDKDVQIELTSFTIEAKTLIRK